MIPNNSLLDALEHLVVQLYCQKKVLPILTNLSEVRWYMFSKMRTESTSLPPTRETLRQKVLRSHYTTVVGKSLIFHIKIYLILKIMAESGRALHLGMKR